MPIYHGTLLTITAATEERRMEEEKNKTHKSPWKIVHGFIGNGDIAIDISKTDDPRPRFSIKIGKRSKEGHMLPFIPMYADGVTLRSIRATVDDLLGQTEVWITEQILEARIQFDQEQANRGRPETRHTGKTERNRNKKKGG